MYNTVTASGVPQTLR